MRRLRHVANQITGCDAREPAAVVALEALGSRTGAVVPGLNLPMRGPDPTGMVSFQSGDVLFGKLRPYLAKSWLTDREGLCSSELIVMRARAGVESRWLGYLAQSEVFVEWAVATSEGVKMPRTSWEKLRHLEVLVPRLSRQHAISDYLDAETTRIDRLVSAKAELRRRLAERGIGLVDSLFFSRRDARPDARVPWLRGLPPTWPVVALGLVAEVFNGKTPAGGTEAVGDVAWTTSGDIDQGVVVQPSAYISERLRRANGLRVAPRGSVLVGLVGQGRTRGLTASLGVPSTLNQNLAAIVPLDGRLESDYLLLVMRLAYEDLRNGGRGGNQAALNCELLKAYRIPVPPVGVQREIVQSASVQQDRDAAMGELLDRSVQRLLERRQALITAAVTGQLEIPGVAA